MGAGIVRPGSKMKLGPVCISQLADISDCSKTLRGNQDRVSLMEKCPKCGMPFTPLKINKHLSTCDGKEPPYTQSRPGRVKSPTMRTSGLEIRRTAAIEVHHILSGNTGPKKKLERIKRDLPHLSGKCSLG
jgi:hypothetical protein